MDSDVEFRTALTLDPVSIAAFHVNALDGPWGDDMPFRDLADGVRGTFLWTADLVGWAVAYDSAIQDPAEIRGVVLIDELEQHLHATWQREVVSRLRELFPGIQFIATTHSPLIAASVGDLGRPGSRDKLFLCELDNKSQEVHVDELESLQTYRFEQVLASRGFKYLIEAANRDLEDVLRRASALTDKGDERSTKEESEYARLKSELAGAEFLKSGTSFEREIDEEKIRKLKDIIKNFEHG